MSGCTLGDIADDCATLIEVEFGGPVDDLRVSTGGAVAQHVAADHPNLVHRLVIHSAAHTLVIAGDRDPFYTEVLFQETAEGIPDARFILYHSMGHPAFGKQFQRDVLAFLIADAPAN